MDKELYVIGYFEDGVLQKYVRKGRNNSIVGYDSLSSAKRGLSQTKSGRAKKDNYKIVELTSMKVVDDVPVNVNKIFKVRVKSTGEIVNAKRFKDMTPEEVRESTDDPNMWDGNEIFIYQVDKEVQLSFMLDYEIEIVK